jgi:membrane protein
MLLGASMVFGAIEHAIEDVFAVRARRRFLISRAVFSVVLVASGSAVFLLHYAMTLGDSFLLAVRGVTLDEFLRESALLDAALTYLPVPVGFLAVLYAPGVARVPLRRALAGAAVFFVLWEVAREGYSWYVEHVARFGLLYGSLATPIVLILWTFYAANILLFSLSCVAALDQPRE